MVPVKVRAKGSNTLLLTYAFLDGGSNTTFCSDQLLKDLGVRGIDTTLSLTTMERENSTKASSLVQLEVFDLDENNFIELYRTTAGVFYSRTANFIRECTSSRRC